MTKPPPPPSNLGRRGATLWRRTVAETEFSPAEGALLEALCSAFDTWDAATKAIKADGVVARDRYGSPKAHPATTIAKDSAATMARLARQLGVELEADGPVGSPYRAKPGPRR